MSNEDASLHPEPPPVDIIVPVYDGLEDTRRCLESVVGASGQTVWRLIVINDHSPDAKVTEWLRHFSRQDSRIELFENTENLGFVATVNRGMAMNPDHDVLLLNSDTEVANDWLDRMQRAAYSAEHAASVTPFSNNATICSYPHFCQVNELPGGFDTAGLDHLFAQHLAGQTVEIPTGVGFCMYIRRQCLQQVGLFDTVNFGKGYGEENDFCMRAHQAGWIHLHALDTFVRHVGGVSFGDSRGERQTHALEAMRRLHPEYESKVQAYVQRDPAQTARRVIDMARLAAINTFATRRVGSAASRLAHKVAEQQPVENRYVLHLVPGNGGGVDRHVRDICRYRTHDCILHMAAEQGVFEVVGQQRTVPIDRAQMKEAAFAWAIGCPALLHAHSTLAPVREVVTSLCNLLGLHYMVTLHDVDFAAVTANVDEQERAARLAFVQGAAERIVPSTFIAGMLANTLGQEISHQLIENGVDAQAVDAVSPVQPSIHEQFKIAVVGALGPSKGLQFLDNVVAALPHDVRVVIIGYVDGQLLPGWFRDRRIWVHGVFEPFELGSLVSSYGCSMAFFPNRQPESYCYALSDAWCAGLPALGPATGAIGERISRTGAGWTFDPNDSAEAVAAILLDCLRAVHRPLERVRFAVDQLLSRQQMIAALNQHYDSLSQSTSQPPDLSTLELLAATQLNGVLFRGELKRLVGDLAFLRNQLAGANEALQALSRDYEGRGGWIEKLEKDLAESKEELSRVEAARAREHTEYVQQVGKLECDLSANIDALQTLGGEYQGRGAWIEKLEKDLAQYAQAITQLEANRAQEHAAYLEQVAKLERSQTEQLQLISELERDISNSRATTQQQEQVIGNLERALASLPVVVRKWLLRRSERTVPLKTTR